jgi:N-acyl amino acid synthase of PEP-CTERM/exosortase system
MFDDHFQVFLADTYESRQINYSIRYQVYCEEMGFENKEDFPSGKEFDQYDDHSVHFIVRHKQSGHWVGAMRIIFKNKEELPLETYCSLADIIDNRDAFQTVELSRLCLVKEIRRRKTDVEPSLGIWDDYGQIPESEKVKLFNNHRKNPYVIWGLLRAATEYGYQNKVKNCFFLTTNALARVLQKGGLTMQNIGSPCYHRGERYPFKMDVIDTYQSKIWNDYKNGYRLFSELSRYKDLKAA